MPDPQPRIPDLGQLRHRITLQSPTLLDQVVSPAGVPPQTSDEDWTPVGTFWAYVEPQRVKRTIGFDAPRTSLWYRVVLRNPGFPVTNRHRIVYQGTRILLIDSVQRVDERSAYLELEVTENVS
jgi:head-tail adaptor